ncbi:MAG: hypothetical protein ACK58J_01400, partial [Planctomyces sp.]
MTGSEFRQQSEFRNPDSGATVVPCSDLHETQDQFPATITDVEWGAGVLAFGQRNGESLALL